MKTAILTMVLIALPFLLIAVQAGQQPLEDIHLLKLADEYTKADSLQIYSIADHPAVKYTDISGKTGYFLQSIDFCEISGYNGITNLAVSIDTSFTITKVEIISSDDTPSYLRKIKRQRFLGKFAGYQGIEDISTITGATMTSSAIIKTLQNIMQLLHKDNKQ